MEVDELGEGHAHHAGVADGGDDHAAALERVLAGEAADQRLQPLVDGIGGRLEVHTVHFEAVVRLVERERLHVDAVMTLVPRCRA